MKLFIDEVYGVFFIENLTTTLTFKMKEIGVLRAEKGRKSLAGQCLVGNLLKEEIWGDILFGQDNVLM